MTPENKSILDEYLHQYTCLERAFYIRGLSSYVRDRMDKVMREEFDGGFSYCGTCDTDVANMIRKLYKHYADWLKLNRVGVGEYKDVTESIIEMNKLPLRVAANFLTKDSSMLNFKHSGATGDIIFSLPTIKAMGGGILNIRPYDYQRAQSIAPLIALQPYIKDVRIGDDYPANAIDLDKFRPEAGHHKNLVEAHLIAQGLTDGSWRKGWLELPNIDIYPAWSNYTVINRTSNYADPSFDWNKEVEYLLTLSDTCYFIGYKDEYETFQKLFNTRAIFFECGFVQAAYMIKYANMFTGCYSAMSTIAMGLGINYRLEQAPGHTCSSLLMPREVIVNV